MTDTPQVTKARYWAFANSGILCIGYGTTIKEARNNVMLQPTEAYEDNAFVDEIVAKLNAAACPTPQVTKTMTEAMARAESALADAERFESISAPIRCDDLRALLAAGRPTVSGDAVERAIKLLEQTPIADIGSNIRPRRSWEQKLDEVQEVIAGLRAIAALSTIDTPAT